MATNAIGLFHYAASYVNSAVVLENNPNKFMFSETPTRFLFNHSIELYLKSFLVSMNVSISTLKQLGHRLDKLSEEARKRGFGLSEEQVGIIGHLNSEFLQHRYINTGLYTCIQIIEIYGLCSSLHYAIGPDIYKKEGLSREVVRLLPLSPTP